MSSRFYWLYLIALLSGSCAAQPASPFMLTAGLESYNFIRMREGGTFQSGRMDGARLTIEGMQNCPFYLAADYLYATGDLSGHTASHAGIVSSLTDEIFELRFGINFRHPLDSSCITAFGGWGMFKEVNQFLPPSPLPCTFTDRFNFLTVGLLTSRRINRAISAGFNVKFRFMQEALSHVSDDPYDEVVALLMKEEVHVRLEAPFIFSAQDTWLFNALMFSPFFEFRHFGGREGFPYDFKDTQFYLYGAKLALLHHF